jgi:hypothetical protein
VEGRVRAARAHGVPRILSGAATAAPDFALGLACLAGVLAPGLLPEGLRWRLPRSVLIEFTAIHCSGFLLVAWMGGWGAAKRTAYVAVLAAGYSLVLGAVALVLHDPWPVAIFWALMGNRVTGVVFGRPPDERRFQAIGITWAGTTTLYVLALCAGVLVGDGFSARGFLLTGFGYYTAVGLSELSEWGWAWRWQGVRREPSR